MGIPSEMRDFWVNSRRVNSFLIASPAEERRIQAARNCTQEGVRAGARAAAIACVATAVPTDLLNSYDGSHKLGRKGESLSRFCSLCSHKDGAKWLQRTLVTCRMVPWAKANLNYTAQALIISAASIAAYFITADKTILECARRNTHYDKTT